jgi:hypothetical protein
MGAWLGQQGYAILREVDEEDCVSRKAARWITAHGLEEVALVLMEAGRPLSPLVAQLSYLAAPFLGSSATDWMDFFGSLADENGVDAFLDQLEGDRGAL